MTVALNVYDAIKSWRSAKNWAIWSKEHPDQWRLVQKVIELRTQHARTNPKTYPGR